MKKIIKYRLYPSFCYSKLELWLNSMSKKGYILIDYGLIKYEFKKSNDTDNVERLFFVYNAGGYRNDDGWYDILLRYPLFSKEYGMSTRSSMLNKNNRRNFIYRTVVEIDPNKVNDGFFTIVKERNCLYLKRTLRDLLLIFIIIIGVTLLVL